jgi:hypothetical protein
MAWAAFVEEELAQHELIDKLDSRLMELCD